MERFVIYLASAFHCQESFDFIAFKKDCLLALWAEMGFLCHSFDMWNSMPTDDNIFTCIKIK